MNTVEVQPKLAVIQGVHAALVTPRRQDRSQVDLGAALELVDFLCRSGVDGIVLLGSTGEFTHFDVEDRLRLTQFAIKRSRAPVMVNVSHSSLDGALTLARQACSDGASALLLMPPHFFRYGQEEIEEFYLRFAQETRERGPAAAVQHSRFHERDPLRHGDPAAGNGPVRRHQGFLRANG